MPPGPFLAPATQEMCLAEIGQFCYEQGLPEEKAGFGEYPEARWSADSPDRPARSRKPKKPQRMSALRWGSREHLLMHNARSGNQASPVTPEHVKAVRDTTKGRTQPWTATELQAVPYKPRTTVLTRRF